MNRREAIDILVGVIADNKKYNIAPACEEENEALDLAIEALEREEEYGQMVVDYTKGEALKSGDWEYTNTSTNDCVSKQQLLEIKNKAIKDAYSVEDEDSGVVFCIRGADDLKEYLNNLFSNQELDREIQGVAESATTTHGRLIDADALAEDIRQKCLADNTPMNIAIGKALTVYLLEAPTIVPATPKTATTTDCISRQQVIKVVHKYFVDEMDKTPHEIDEDGDDVYTGMKAVNELLKHNKHISKAIKALPPVTPIVSEDCISREYMLKLQRELHGWMPNDKSQELWQKIKDAPPVTPTERTGEWIVYPLKDEGRVELECPECGYALIRAADRRPHFCENCGARMMGGDTE